MSKVVIRQYKSAIGQKVAARQTLEALGLRRPGNIVVREDSATLRGQIRKIAHLVEVRADRREQDVEVEQERRAQPQAAKKSEAKGWQRRRKAAEAEASGSAS
jgi:large subunit ribosomal protein L30